MTEKTEFTIKNDHLFGLANRWDWTQDTVTYIEFSFASKQSRTLRAYYNTFELGFNAGGGGYSKICELLQSISRALGHQDTDYTCHSESVLSTEIARKLTEYGHKRGQKGKIIPLMMQLHNGYILILKVEHE